VLDFSNCKINLGLNIVSKRADGYHDLETIFYPIPFCDALEIIADKKPGSTANDTGQGIRFSTSGLSIPGSAAANLCIKAYQLIKTDFPELPPVQMHLHKVVPMGAGLGGGSSNGAFALRLLNQKFELGIDQNQLLHYALQLGSDCPFFMVNKPCYATSRGEVLEPIGVDLSGCTIVLINPGIHVSTNKAFASIKPKKPGINCRDIISQPISNWRESLVNDFEAGVFQLHPELDAIKAGLYQSGAVYAAMSGSGSTLYGIFEKPPVDLPAYDPSFLVKQMTL
jgi:4-diphosphocytidyl-2-C-methyl-D-erythritol kinase